MKSFVKKLAQYTNQGWFPFFLGFLALIDIFIIILPIDGLYIGGLLAHLYHPTHSRLKNSLRRSGFVLLTALGSVLGSTILGILFLKFGFEFLHFLLKDLETTALWIQSQNLYLQYGTLLIFLTGVSPIAQQPIVIISLLAKVSLVKIISILFLGRLIKYYLIFIFCKYFPNMLTKMWGIKDEVQEIKKISEE